MLIYEIGLVHEIKCSYIDVIAYYHYDHHHHHHHPEDVSTVLTVAKYRGHAIGMMLEVTNHNG